MDLLMYIAAFGGGIGCLVIHPGMPGRLVGLIGPALAVTSMQVFPEGGWAYFGLNVAAAITGGYAFGYGRIAKIRAIADAPDDES